MIDKIVDIIKTHKDNFGLVFNSDVFKENDFLEIAKEVEKISTISDIINRREQLTNFFRNVEDDFDMGVSTETLDDLINKIIV